VWGNESSIAAPNGEARKELGGKIKRRGWIFSKMGKTFFFLGFCPPSIRAVWRGFNADSVLDFVREEEGSGEESARAFLFDFWQLLKRKEN